MKCDLNCLILACGMRGHDSSCSIKYGDDLPSDCESVVVVAIGSENYL